MAAAVASAGLAAPAGAPWSIDVRPYLLRVDTSDPHHQRARAFGVDLDLRLLSVHAHVGWPGISIPLPAPASGGPH
ncbi:MAG: hypothetical protein ACM3SQ_02950 [Betaproteobacteria bacterium]